MKRASFGVVARIDRMRLPSLAVLLLSVCSSTGFVPTPAGFPSYVEDYPKTYERGNSINPAIIHGRVSNSLLSPTSTVIFGKKKGGAATSSTAKGKVQVKLLKHVAGTGQAGDVIMVTPAFFNNKLRPTKSAKMITDEEVVQQQSEVEQHEQEAIAIAEALQEKISKLKLTLRRKAGPDGQLFGGISPKMIVAELQAAVGDEEEDFLSQKSVKLTEIVDNSGETLQGDVKHTGTFSAKIVLRKDISASFGILVEPES